MKTLLLVAVALTVGSTLVAFPALCDPEPGLVAKCESCHGPKGDSRSSATPRLNGQAGNYLRGRLKQFADPTRNTPHATYQMWETAKGLSDPETGDIASYFANQAPTPASPVAPLAAAGERIYREGAGDGIPACQQCHGSAGEGSSTAPRLAGQHAAYLEQQMSAFMLGLRVSQPMNKHLFRMSPDQFKALSAYLSGH